MSSAPAPDGPYTAADAIVEALVELGVAHAFGVIGGAIAPFCRALSRSTVRLMHARHESGAAFAATEASLVTGKLTVVFVTTGPGLTNCHTGMMMARTEGAKVLFVTGCTSAPQRGRGAFQETGGVTSALAPLFTNGALFHHAALVEDPLELDAFVARLASGVTRPNGFVAHLGFPIAVQTARRSERTTPRPRSSPPVCDAETVVRSVELLAHESFVIWAGFGARHASDAVRRLAELTGAYVMATPRAKGVMPENHPQYLGVTGHGGHATVEEYMKQARPARALVLGSRLGEMVSFWSPDLVPREGFVHVDCDPGVFGSAYPSAPTFGVEGEIGAFVEALIAAWPSPSRKSMPPAIPAVPLLEARSAGAVRPSFLMQSVQREVVDRSDAIVLVEAGNSLALGNRYLRFSRAGRYRASTCFASMGHASAGVLGAALGQHEKAVAIVGDGAMLMQNEINTAVAYGLGAMWIVVNDARYGMIAQGMQSLGWEPFATEFPRTDFVAIARAMGADGVSVVRECDLDDALRAGLASPGPFVVDVMCDPNEIVPSGRRNRSLATQGVNAVSGAADAEDRTPR
ncbi:MAG TPA: thiamine pyrophosphate-binding protein [Polyangiaceae bacterium]